MSAPFVLATPRWLQYGALAAALLASASALAWVARLYQAQQLSMAHALLGGLALLVLVLVANPRLWSRWLHCVADGEALWLPTHRGELLRIPWSDVARLERRRATMAGIAHDALFVYVDLPRAQWRRVDWRPRGEDEDPEVLPAGYLPVRLGTLGHDVGAVRDALERLRHREPPPR